jgi:ectoine hydroxylase-related dioxygenase (phytanoyl-CoA dioxygenase family)
MQLKLPKSSGRSVELAWHQDGPFLPLDRMSAIQMWVALVPVTTDMGPMVHLSGSHREPLSGMLAYSGEKAKDIYPELWDKYEESEPHAMGMGDAVFHHSQTWHYSFPNETDRIRWAMSSYRFDSRALYTGQPNFNTDNLGLVPEKTFDHPNFPIVYP